MRTRLRPAAFLASLLAIGLIAAGCGDSDGEKSSSGSSDAQALLTKAFEKPVPSADVDLDATVNLKGIPGLGGPIGLKIDGPYASNGQKKIPSVDWDIALEVLGQTLTGGLILTPENAYVDFQGQAYEAGTSAFSAFERAYAAQPDSEPTGGTFKALGIDPSKWLTDAEVADGPDIGGDSTRKITGEVDVAAVVRDVLELAESPAVRKQLESSGTPVPAVPKVTDKQIKQIEDAIESATIEVDVDENDIARRVAGDVAFVIPEGVDAGGLESGSVKLAYSLPKLGVKVDPKAPKNPRPLSDLLAGLGGLTGGLSSP